MLIKLQKSHRGLTTGQVLDMADPDAELLIADGTAEKAVKPPAPPETKSAATADEIRKIVTEQVQGLAEPVKKSLAFVESVRTSLADKPCAIYAKGKAGLGQFLEDVAAVGDVPGPEAILQRKEAPERIRKYVGALVERKSLADAQAVAVDSAGGVLVPREQRFELLTQEFGMEREFLSRVRAIPMAGQVVTYPRSTISTRATAAGRHGGIQAYKIDESETKTPSRVNNFTEIELKLTEMTVLVPLTDSVVRFSAINLADMVGRIALEEITFRKQRFIFSGTGAGQPLGFTSAANPSRVAVTRANASQVRSADIRGMWSRRHAPNTKNYVWFIEQSVEPELDQMAWMPREGGTAAIAVKPEVTYDTNGNMRLKGAPVIVSEFCSAMGTVGDIVLADLSQYLYAYPSSNDPEFAESIHVRFVNNERLFRWVTYDDGRPWWNTAYTPASGGTDTRTPFVVLAT